MYIIYTHTYNYVSYIICNMYIEAFNWEREREREVVLGWGTFFIIIGESVSYLPHKPN